MKRCLAVLLSMLLLMSSAPLVSADIIYNDDQLNWGEYACTHRETEEVAGVASTCIMQGYTAYTRCVECKLPFGKEPLPLANHVYDNGNDTDCNICGAHRDACNHQYDNACDASCNVEGCGYVRQVGEHIFDNACDTDCNVCGVVREVEPHAYGVVVTDATCTVAGKQVYTCANCGDSYTEVISALGHTSVVISGKAPTCTESGLTDGEKCSVCGTILVAQETIEALGHDYKVVVTDATCTVDGKKVYTCANCGDSYTEVISALGHTSVVISGKAPTCTESGLTEGEKCSVCGTILVAQETIEALGHDYKVVVTDPTCTVDGKKVYTCANCGDSYTEVVPAIGEHTYDDDKDAECNLCGHVRQIALPGDADGNGRVNNRDLGLLQQYLNDYGVDIDPDAMDVDGNGRVNNRDLGLLQQYLNDWNVELK